MLPHFHLKVRFKLFFLVMDSQVPRFFSISASSPLSSSLSSLITTAYYYCETDVDDVKPCFTVCYLSLSFSFNITYLMRLTLRASSSILICLDFEGFHSTLQFASNLFSVLHFLNEKQAHLLRNVILIKTKIAQ